MRKKQKNKKKELFEQNIIKNGDNACTICKNLLLKDKNGVYPQCNVCYKYANEDMEKFIKSITGGRKINYSKTSKKSACSKCF